VISILLQPPFDLPDVEALSPEALLPQLADSLLTRPLQDARWLASTTVDDEDDEEGLSATLAAAQGGDGGLVQELLWSWEDGADGASAPTPLQAQAPAVAGDPRPLRPAGVGVHMLEALLQESTIFNPHVVGPWGEGAGAPAAAARAAARSAAFRAEMREHLAALLADPEEARTPHGPEDGADAVAASRSEL